MKLAADPFRGGGNLEEMNMNERMRFNPAEATAAGQQDAQALLIALASREQGDSPAKLLGNALAEIIGQAVENRVEECEARKSAFCEIIGPVLLRLQASVVPAIGDGDSLLAELQAAHAIIRNALAVMATEQKMKWGELNERDHVAGEEITRANERARAIALVSNATESDGGEL